MNFLHYPFTESKQPQLTRIYAEQLGFSPEFNFLFPDILMPTVAYHHGVDKENWNDEIQDLVIYCREHQIDTLYLFWNVDDYVKLNLTGIDWKIIYPVPVNWDPVQQHGIGSHVGIMGTLVSTLEFLPPNIPYQLFISNPQSFLLPKLNTENSMAIAIIRNKRMNIFSHGPFIYNLAKKGLGSKIKSYLQIATALGMKGVVFHVGKSVDLSYQEALNNMRENILEGLEDGLCKFILETPASQGTEMLSNFFYFLQFASEIYAIHKNFTICIDSMHVFACNYDPYHYLKHCLNSGCPVALIHYNDSIPGWGSKKDRHARINEGKIPWIFLEKMAKLASENHIPMVTEF